jgi:hypothetical protein
MFPDASLELSDKTQTAAHTVMSIYTQHKRSALDQLLVGPDMVLRSQSDLRNTSPPVNYRQRHIQITFATCFHGIKMHCSEFKQSSN